MELFLLEVPTRMETLIDADTLAVIRMSLYIAGAELPALSYIHPQWRLLYLLMQLPPLDRRVSFVGRLCGIGFFVLFSKNSQRC